MNPKAASVISAIEHATRHMKTSTGGVEQPPLDPKQAWGAHCSALFRETMRQLASRGTFVDRQFVDENADANEIGRRIRHAHAHWEKIDLQKAQKDANDGAVVVGSYINPTPGEPGHLGFVYPAEIHRSHPLVRDGNIHRNKTTGAITGASSYGAVPAGVAFPLGHTSWFKYRHSVRS